MQTSTDLSPPLEYSSFSILNLSDVPAQDDTNPDYTTAFSSLLLDQLNTQDMQALLESQQAILKRLDKTNQKISSSNQKSSDTFSTYGTKDFQSYISLLNRMKQDLDFVFKRIRMLKKKLELKYPHSYSNALQIAKENTSDSEPEDQVEADESDAKLRSDSTASRLSASKSAFSSLFETARNRISSLSREQSDPSESKSDQADQ